MLKFIGKSKQQKFPFTNNFFWKQMVTFSGTYLDHLTHSITSTLTTFLHIVSLMS
jgi:hypothetical protein